MEEFTVWVLALATGGDSVFALKSNFVIGTSNVSLLVLCGILFWESLESGIWESLENSCADST